MSNILTLATMPLIAASTALRPHLSQITLAFSATLLAIFGNDINGSVKDLVKDSPFPVRLLVFILLVAFGYGALTLAISHFLAYVLAGTDNLWLSPIVVAAFVLVGFLAEHKKHI